MHRGFAKIYRKFLQWEWYDDNPCKILYLHCLLKANHKDKDYRGTLIVRGTFVSSYQTLADETGLSVKQVRLAMSKLEPKYLASCKTKRGQTISVINFETYNSFDSKEGTLEGKERAEQGQREGTIRATTKKVKNEKNEKKPNPRDFLKLNNITWIDQDIWVEWINHKVKLKQATTDRALRANIKKLEGMDKNRADYLIGIALDKGWKDIYEPKDNNFNNKPKYQTHQEKSLDILDKYQERIDNENNESSGSTSNAIILS